MTTTSNAAERLTDVSDMYVVHRVFRREFVLIPQLVRQVAAGDTARAAVVGEHARLILAGPGHAPHRRGRRCCGRSCSSGTLPTPS